MNIPISGQLFRRIRNASRVAFWLGVIAIPVLSPFSILNRTDFYQTNGLGFILPAVAAFFAFLAVIVYLAAIALGQAQTNREFEAWLAGDAEGDRPIILFLRSFDVAKSGLIGRALRRIFKAILAQAYVFSAVGASTASAGAISLRDTGGSDAEKDIGFALGPAIYDAEEELDNAIDSRALFVAIGNKRVSYGAAKFIVTDAVWQNLFRRLTEAALLIFMMPGASSAVLWELSQIVQARNLLAKTVFIMPRRGVGKVVGRDGRTGSQKIRCDVAELQQQRMLLLPEFGRPSKRDRRPRILYTRAAKSP
jgi:hypothetical protein